MRTLKTVKIDFRFQNWGKTERIVCEQDQYDSHSFSLLKQGQNVGTIVKKGQLWISSNNNIFLPEDIAKIGAHIDDYLKGQHLFIGSSH
ncbi:hypothetical protein EV200_101654 [Pedobacter psychrotolerans]|uniref:Uncharacterized protein n=1 Tax=Pedobacter psychrotolerans TaxID=1843235 RepID=A0A4V2S0D3_9SPHI|nr:hypothetical protein [Pedobacter psychrotolerans]TCO31206.1 hypothetical protein EV200_101654 [Pedobacter psychrotolerans]GGE41415.1 hypothetical protein GCM10011413_04120 [Pedobacter psychrotolerans]